MPAPVVFYNDSLAKGIIGGAEAYAKGKERQFEREKEQSKKQKEIDEDKAIGQMLSELNQKAQSGGKITAFDFNEFSARAHKAGVPSKKVNEALKAMQAINKDVLQGSAAAQYASDMPGNTPMTPQVPQGAPVPQDMTSQMPGIGQQMPQQAQQGMLPGQMAQGNYNPAMMGGMAAQNPAMAGMGQMNPQQAAQGMGMPQQEQPQQPGMPAAMPQQFQQPPQTPGVLSPEMERWYAASPFKQHQQLAQYSQEQKKFAQQQNVSDRDYNYKLNQPYHDKMSAKMNALEGEKRGLRMMQDALSRRDLSFFSKDNVARMSGDWGGWAASPEGAQFLAGQKQLALNDISQITGPKNQFIEKTLISALPKLGDSNEANEVKAAWIQRRLEGDEAEISLYRAIRDQYATQGMPEPRNIDNLVERGMQSIKEDLDNKFSYKIGTLLDGIKSEAQLMKDLERKPLDKEVLSPKRAAAMVKKYGSPEKARENAKKLGYIIPSGAQQKKWSGNE